MDEVDLANHQAELLLTMQIAARKPTLPRTGFCHNCDTELTGDRLFCDHDCSVDWHKRESRKGK